MEHDHSQHNMHELPQSKLRQYSVLILILAAIFIGAIVWTINSDQSNFETGMRVFMGLFFLVFGFFKILDWKGFAAAYAGYDIVAAKSRAYALTYPLIELSLAILYLTNTAPLPTNIITVIVMIVSSIGVAKALARGSQFQCACLGVLVKLPMSTITLIEDVGMGLMAIVSIVLMYR